LADLKVATKVVMRVEMWVALKAALLAAERAAQWDLWQAVYVHSQRGALARPQRNLRNACDRYRL